MAGESEFIQSPNPPGHDTGGVSVPGFDIIELSSYFKVFL